MTSSLKNVLVLGAAYAGAPAASVLANNVPTGWRVILIDRNTHANHAYVLPRFSVLPGHEHKAFIPLRNVFKLPADTEHDHLVLQAHVKAINPKSIILSRAFPEHGIPTTSLDYEYVIYALGSILPDPVNLWGTLSFNGTKPESINFMKANQKSVEDAGSVLVCGGGALGIQFATDIKAIYPHKSVTLLHSRTQLLPRYDEEMHVEILKAMEATGIDAMLGERLDLDSAKEEPPKRNEQGQRVVRTLSGREIAADLIMLCTGQMPQTSFLRDMDPDTVNPDDQFARVLKTMQLTTRPRERSDVDGVTAAMEDFKLTESDREFRTYPNIFVVGDAADAFDAIKAGHTAHKQADVAAHNVLKLIKGDRGEALEEYTPGLPAIKVSLGMTKSVHQSGGVVSVKNVGVEDMRAAGMWPYFGMTVDDAGWMEDFIE